MYEKITKCPKFTSYLPEKYVSPFWTSGQMPSVAIFYAYGC